MTTKIKICGITNMEDALTACDLGADAIGFVFAESPRQIDVAAAKEIAAAIPPFVKRVGVFTAESQEVAQIASEVSLDLIQLHGGQSEDFARSLGAERVVRVQRMRDKRSIAELDGYQSCVAYLLDTWSKDKLGGTGEAFNWNLAVQAKSLGKSIILAGGLSPENISYAIEAVRPYAVDISSGVEAFPGKKDHSKLKELIDNVRSKDNA